MVKTLAKKLFVFSRLVTPLPAVTKLEDSINILLRCMNIDIIILDHHLEMDKNKHKF